MIKERISFGFFVAFVPTLCLCGEALADSTPRERGDLAIAARAILHKYCSECHKPQAASFDILDVKQLTAKDRPVQFVNLDSPRSQIIELIEDGSMPPGGRAKRPSPEELALLKKWIAEKAPSFPRSFEEPYVLHAIELDRSNRKGDSARYVSLAHLVRDGSEIPSLKEQQLRLQQALDAATTKERATPLQPIDDAATVFRIDLARLGWNARDLFDEIEVKGAIGGVAQDMIPFDLISLENPYVPDQGKGNSPVQYLRGDWLASALAPGTGLAAEMQSLVELSESVVKGGDPPCGPKFRAFEKSGAPSGGNPPITSWYSSERVNPFEVSFWKTTQVPDAVTLGESFRFDVKSEREARFVLLNILSNGELRIVPVQGTVIKKDQLFQLGPTPTTFFKIASILSGAAEAKEHFILLLAEGEMPLPTIVRSRHDAFSCPKDRAPIYRFFFDKTPESFSANKVVRKVISFTVKAK